MKVLVTGGSGKLAPFVVKELLDAGHEVILFSRREPQLKHVPVILGDINVFEDCSRALSNGVDAIQHLAAQAWPVDHPHMRASAAAKSIPFDATMRSNLMGTYYLLQAALENNVGIFIMTGSNCALGHGYRISGSPFPFRYLPVDEGHPSDVEDSYSFTKWADEQLLASYTRAYGMRTYALRSAGICNENRRRQMAEGAAPISGWNDWLWAWVGSEDIASAHRLLMERAQDIEPHGVYYCNANDTSALEPSLDLVERYRPDLLPLRHELPGHSTFFSNAALQRAAGWQHRTSWREYLPGA